MKSKMTIEDLATMVKRGFDQTATKENFVGLKQHLQGVEERLTQRLEILEHRVLTEHATRIEILEDDMRKIKTKLNIS